MQSECSYVYAMYGYMSENVPEEPRALLEDENEDTLVSKLAIIIYAYALTNKLSNTCTNIAMLCQVKKIQLMCICM